MAGWQQNLRPKIRLTIDRQTTTDSTCSRSKTFHHKKIAWLLQSHRAQAGDGHVRFVDQVPHVPAGEVCQDFGGVPAGREGRLKGRGLRVGKARTAQLRHGGVPEHSGVAGREGRLQGRGLRVGMGRTAQLGQGGVFWQSDQPASAIAPARNPLTPHYICPPAGAPEIVARLGRQLAEKFSEKNDPTHLPVPHR